MQRNLEAVQAALKQREKRQGASIEEIAEELQRKKTALETAKREIKALKSLNNVCVPLSLPRGTVLTRTGALVGSEEVREGSHRQVARVPSPHCASVQGLLWLPSL